MEELIARITASVGIDEATASKAVGMILGFLKSEGPTDQVNQMLEALPGADGLIGQAAEGGAGGLMGAVSGMMGGGVMGLGQKLMGLGLGMGEVQGVAKETVSFAKEKAGDDTVDAIIAEIPGLSQFV